MARDEISGVTGSILSLDRYHRKGSVVLRLRVACLDGRECTDDHPEVVALCLPDKRGDALDALLRLVAVTCTRLGHAAVAQIAPLASLGHDLSCSATCFCSHARYARFALAISCRSRIHVFRKTVKRMIRLPGAIQ
jgi:hypothetical protein